MVVGFMHGRLDSGSFKPWAHMHVRLSTWLASCNTGKRSSSEDLGFSMSTAVLEPRSATRAANHARMTISLRRSSAFRPGSIVVLDCDHKEQVGAANNTLGLFKSANARRAFRCDSICKSQPCSHEINGPT